MTKARNLANLLADGAVGADELASTLDLSGKTLTLPAGVGAESVGINAPTPRGRLHIGGDLSSGATDAAAINLKQTSTTAATGIYLERSGERKGYYMYLGGSSDSLTFQRNNAGTKSDVMSLTRDGNVGIGTNTPASPFEVNGQIKTTDINAANLVGQVAAFAMDTPPTGWLVANGAAVSRTTYAELFAAIGTVWGSGDGSTTFNLPDLRASAPVGLGTSTDRKSVV